MIDFEGDCSKPAAFPLGGRGSGKEVSAGLEHSPNSSKENLQHLFEPGCVLFVIC